MANLKDNNYHNLRLRINKDEYWDFFVNKDAFGSYKMGNGDSMYDGCLISFIDASLPQCVEGNEWLYSTEDYVWEYAYSIDHTLFNIGYTGIDNGLIKYRKDRISNKDFFNYFTKSKYEITEDDKRLKLHAVSGSTLLYDYPLSVEDGVIKFNGGFYQGFFKTECDKYYILPSNLKNGDVWEFEFQLNKCELEKESSKTLNDKYPQNKGIFFYMGARAENKWIYMYDDKEDECFTLSYDDYIEGGEINKKDYIVGNFYNVEPEYYDDDIDDYLNFNYYDDSYYTTSEEELFSDIMSCDFENVMDDYLEVNRKAKLIDESLPHITLDGSCCCSLGNGGKGGTVQVAFFNACGCLRYKTVKSNKGKCSNDVRCNDIFGENDYIDDFDGVEEDGGYFEDEMNITDFEYETDSGFNLKSANDYYFYTDNKFLLFDRTPTGYTVKDWIEGTQMMYFGKKNKFKGNLFILMNRTPTGYTVSNINELIEEENSKYTDFYNDIYNNAFALRVTDEGEIGYRYLILDCESDNEGKYSVIEGYSFPGVIKDCQWHTIHVRIAEGFSEMKLYFYVDGKLVYITTSLPLFNFHKFNDLYEKQEGVPFNISLGGGTQGLAETILPNYMLNPTRTYPLEENFAGTFIGYMKTFKFYNCNVAYENIVNNYLWETSKRH